MFFELFVLGTFWFWILLTIEFALLVYFLEHESYVAAPSSLLVFVGLLFLAGSGVPEAIQWVIANPLYTVAGIVGYFVFGTLYVISPYIGKWWWFVRDVRDHNRDEKQAWLASRPHKIGIIEQNIERYKIRIQSSSNQELIDSNQELIEGETDALQAWNTCNGVMTEALLPYWKKHQRETTFSDWFGRSISIEKPTPDKFKARITAWIVYWPPSLFWTLLNDPFRRIGRMIYENVAHILKSISDSAWKDEDKLG